MNKQVNIFVGHDIYFVYRGGYDNFIKELDICKKRGNQFLKLPLERWNRDNVIEEKDFVIQVCNIVYFEEQTW